MSELIEKLKNNEKQFGLLSEEEQECLRQVRENTEYLTWDGADKPVWESRGKGNDFFFIGTSYRIKPDYQPEPEYLDCPITYDEGFLCIYREDVVVKKVDYPHTFIYLYYISSLLKFRGFYIDGFFNTRIDIQDIAELISKGQKVVARFVK